MTRKFMLFVCLLCCSFTCYSVCAGEEGKIHDPEEEVSWTEKLKQDAARAGDVIKEDASKAGSAIKSGAIKTGESVKKGAVKTGEAAKKGYDKMADYFSDDE